MADGTVATATFQIASSPSSNPIPIQLTSVVATTAGATSIPASGGSAPFLLQPDFVSQYPKLHQFDHQYPGKHLVFGILNVRRIRRRIRRLASQQ